MVARVILVRLALAVGLLWIFPTHLFLSSHSLFPMLLLRRSCLSLLSPSWVGDSNFSLSALVAVELQGREEAMRRVGSTQRFRHASDDATTQRMLFKLTTKTDNFSGNQGKPQ